MSEVEPLSSLAPVPPEATSMINLSDRPSTRSRSFGSHGRQRGFSFPEILVVVVVGVLASLVGFGLGASTIARREAPETKARPLLEKMRSQIDSWRGAYKASPPLDVHR